jgi:hypothetical protein
MRVIGLTRTKSYFGPRHESFIVGIVGRFHPQRYESNSRVLRQMNDRGEK